MSAFFSLSGELLIKQFYMRVSQAALQANNQRNKCNKRQ
ncbi:hypothetical protein CPter291_3680 [Collimonas pratensis]|uniref:Uncharacterized protein n=1 Tax=Collimonas pratensis TaxID=279113 RepID=A0A127R0C9_9BURK|nr:hypothetical protein CPter91_3624 [Collimonas pratensis]AMP15914.1 hypothetical protein CPter291_3680 [Collimonas pratensis]